MTVINPGLLLRWRLATPTVLRVGGRENNKNSSRLYSLRAFPVSKDLGKEKRKEKKRAVVGCSRAQIDFISILSAHPLFLLLSTLF